MADRTNAPLNAEEPDRASGPFCSWMDGVRRLRAGLRQLLFRRAFRIEAPVWPPPLPVAADSAVDVSAEKEPPAPTPRQPGAESRALLEVVAELATALWRIRRRMLQEGDGKPPEQWRRLYRYVESAWDAVHSAKAEIRDHTGEHYVTGMALNVIAFQPREGITDETIEETVKPSVFFADKLIRRGEVIVAIPPTDAKTSASEEDQDTPDRQAGGQEN